MADLSTFKLDIVGVNLFSPNADVVLFPSHATIGYNGHRLFCRGEAVGSLLALHIWDSPVPNPPFPVGGSPDTIPGIAGNFTTATVDVTYKGQTATASFAGISYGGGPMRFALRFNTRSRTAAVYIDEVVAVLDDLVSEQRLRMSAGEAAADLTDAAGDAQTITPLSFIALEDGGPNNDKKPSKMPYRVVFLQDEIDIPIEQVGKGATALVFPEDGGGEAGPMGFQLG